MDIVLCEKERIKEYWVIDPNLVKRRRLIKVRGRKVIELPSCETFLIHVWKQGRLKKHYVFEAITGSIVSEGSNRSSVIEKAEKTLKGVHTDYFWECVNRMMSTFIQRDVKRLKENLE